MAKTYDAIATQTLGSATTTVTFSSIVGTYTDLVLVCSIKTGADTYQPILRFNSDTGSNYSQTSMSGNGSSALSNRHTNQNGIYANPGAGVGTSGNFFPWVINIMNYSNTFTYKDALHRFNNAQSVVTAGIGIWRNTSAITTVSITAESGSNDFQSGSTFTLYGVKSA